MSRNEIIEKLAKSFSHYYTIKREDVVKPFIMEAEFKSHTEQYFLVKAAHLSDIDSNEFVYFASESELDSEKLDMLQNLAWNEGLSRIKPYFGHKNSDITVIIVADKIEASAGETIKKLTHYKSYCFTFKGWSHFRIIALETSTGKFFFNRFGKDLRKVFNSIK